MGGGEGEKKEEEKEGGGGHGRQRDGNVEGGGEFGDGERVKRRKQRVAGRDRRGRGGKEAIERLL